MGLKRRSRASKERAASWIGEAGAEQAVVGVEGVLVGHGGARRMGWWNAVASGNAEISAIAALG